MLNSRAAQWTHDSFTCKRSQESFCVFPARRHYRFHDNILPPGGIMLALRKTRRDETRVGNAGKYLDTVPMNISAHTDELMIHRCAWTRESILSPSFFWIYYDHAGFTGRKVESFCEWGYTGDMHRRLG